MPRRALAIVNPRSAGGDTAARWPAVEALLRAAVPGLEVEPTRAPRDAERIAREGARAGVERILVVGGDGTLSEVATGLIDSGLADQVGLAVLPWGTGCDLARGLGISADPEVAIACMARGRARKIDAGRVHLQGESGSRTACFVNVASMGISGLVTQRMKHSSRALGGAVAYALAAIGGIRAYRSEHVRVRVDGEVVHDAPLVLAAVANGPCFGGGMQVAPGAMVDDGWFDLVIVGELSRPRLLGLLARGYRGRHIGHPAVRQHRGRSIEAEAALGRVPIELDGEPLGSLPARYEMLPSALTLLTVTG